MFLYIFNNMYLMQLYLIIMLQLTCIFFQIDHRIGFVSFAPIFYVIYFFRDFNSNRTLPNVYLALINNVLLCLIKN